jgi:PAS domain S-box-containing protein
MRDRGWPGLFQVAFTQSRNPMVLLDDQRRFVDVNRAFLRMLGYTRDDLIGKPGATIIAGDPAFTPEEWLVQLARARFTGVVGVFSADGSVVVHQWGATVEEVTGQRLVLLVALSTSRWGSRFRRPLDPEEAEGDLSEREREVVYHVAHGRSGPEIAEELGISHDTVRTHVRNAMTKVGARSRAHLVARALGEGLALR